MSICTFAWRFIQYPKDIGSIVPSSPWLARTMVGAIDISKAESIVEFGSGNGSVTREILKMKPENCSLAAYEIDEAFRPYLDKLSGKRYTPLYEDICSMNDRFQKESVDVIFSCLPLGSFDPDLTTEILRKAQYVLKSGGYFIQFQYFLQNKKDVEKYFDIKKIKWEIRNIPPAFVYIAEKK